MDDDNELELSLGLSFGGSSGKSKSRNVPLDSKVEAGSSSQSAGKGAAGSDVPFKNLFPSNVVSQEQSGKQAGLLPQENFWTDIGKSIASTADHYDAEHASQSMFTKRKELWISNNRSSETEEEKSALKKLRLASEEINFQKKLEKVGDHVEGVGKNPDDVTFVKQMHISIATDDGSTGENEGVAESEAEVSSSWLVSQHKDISKGSDLLKGSSNNALSDSSGIGFQGQKQQNYSPSVSSELVKVTYGTPLSLQPQSVSIMAPQPAKPTAAGAAIAISSSSQSLVHAMLPSNGDPSAVQETNVDSQKLVFGYSSSQLPTLETKPSWAFGSQHNTASSLAPGTSNTPIAEDEAMRSNVPIQIHSRASLASEKAISGLARGNGKNVMEAGTSSSARVEEGKVMGLSVYFFGRRIEGIANPRVVECFQDAGAIKAGVAPNLKFGGCGSYPDLPWVSATGSGPRGKTISGVTYKYSKNQVKIVCACHGSHMSPEEFIQHASADNIIPENNTSLTSFTSSPSGSAQN